MNCQSELELMQQAKSPPRMVIRGGATQLHSVLDAFTAASFCTQLYEVPVFSVKKNYSITVLLATFCSLHPGSPHY